MVLLIEDVRPEGGVEIARGVGGQRFVPEGGVDAARSGSELVVQVVKMVKVGMTPSDT